MSIRAVRFFRVLALEYVILLIAVLLGATDAAGQELTGTIYGKVVAEDDSLLPGVTVTVKSPQLIKGVAVTVTNEQGLYRATALPPGIYAVEARLGGFGTVSKTNVNLAAGASLAVDFRLGIAGVKESVTISGGAPLLDVRNTQTARVLQNEFIANVPTARTVGELVITMPGVQDAEYKLFPSQSIHGATPRDNQYNVDGAVMGDSSGGNLTIEIPFDIIQEVQVSTGGISAEFGEASGGVFNFITKSGSNRLQGGGNLFGYSDNTSSKNVDAELRALGVAEKSGVISHRDAGFYLGGPIKKERAWYFGNIRKVHEEMLRPDFPARPLGWDDWQGFIKVTTQLTSGVRLDTAYTYRDLQDFPSQARSDFTINDDSRAWGKDHRKQYVANAGLTWALNDRALFDFRYGENDTTLDTTYPEGDFSPYLEINSGKVMGRPVTTLGNTFERGRRGIKANVSYFLAGGWGDSHSFKAGVHTEHGTFGRGAVMPNDTSYELRSGAASRVLLYNTPGTNRLRVTNYAAYIQDQWSLAQRLTLNLGVRFQTTEGWLGEQDLGGGRWFPRETFSEVRDVIKWSDASPRLGLTWDLTGKGRASVKLSYGRYYTPLNTRDIPNRASAGRRLYDWNDRNGDLVYQVGEEGTLRGNTTIRGNAVVTDPDLRRPYTDTIHLAFERQIGDFFAASVTGIYRHEAKLMEVISLARPHSAYIPVSVINPIDNRPLTIFTLDPAFQGVSESTMLTNPPDLERKYYGVELAAERRMSERWQFTGSTTIGKSEGTSGNSFATANVYSNPNSLINNYGALEMDTRLNLKLQGTYVAPGDVRLNMFYNGISGRPISLQLNHLGAQFNGSRNVRFGRADNPAIVVESLITVRGDERGTERFDFRHRLSFRAEKQFQVGRTRIGLVADVLNSLNINTVTAVESLIYDQANFMKPAIIENPRTLKVGVRFDF